MTGLTVYSTLPPLVQAHYDTRFLIRAKHILAAYEHAQKKSLPGGKGKTIYWDRYTPLAKQTTDLTETTDGGISLSTRQQLNVEEVSAAVAPLGDFIALSDIASKTSIDPNVNSKVDIIGQQAGESIDYLVMKALATGINRRRADGDASYQKAGTAASGSTTTLVDTTVLTQANDYWNGGRLIITAGTNYGEARLISDFVNSTGTVTVDGAFPKAIDSTSKYRIVVGTDLAGTDILDTITLRKAKRDVENAKALRYENGYWIMMLDPDLSYDFMGDPTWKDAAVYKDQVDSLYTGEIGKWLGIRMVGTTQLYRESVAGVEADGTGAVHLACLVGKECYGVVRLDNQERKIYIRDWEALGQPLPFYSTVGWHIIRKEKVLNGMFGVGIMCGATDEL